MLKKTLSTLSITICLGGYAFAEPQVSTSQSNTAQQLDQKDHDVIVYSSKNCFSCKLVKDLLDEEKIEYTEKNVDNNAALFAEMKAKTNEEKVPQVMFKGKSIGGYWAIKFGDGLAEILEKKNTTEPDQTEKSN